MTGVAWSVRAFIEKNTIRDMFSRAERSADRD
jgi:hypothetical protein